MTTIMEITITDFLNKQNIKEIIVKGTKLGEVFVAKYRNRTGLKLN